MRSSIGFLALLLAAGACALPRPVGSRPVPAAQPKAAAPSAAPAAVTVPCALEPSSAAARALQTRLGKARSQQVTVPARLLRELLRDQGTLQAQNHELRSQLEALKKIDLQQAEATVQ